MPERPCPDCGTPSDPTTVCSCGYDPAAPDPCQEADLREPEAAR
ncbi:hypothetical protein [Streptomyces violaceus]|uniref:Uncharacterized protein n=1 Tax=Streptomyces violaceus TaxID=1936 RepID=A0ABZ1NKV6_STRVL